MLVRNYKQIKLTTKPGLKVVCTPKQCIYYSEVVQPQKEWGHMQIGKCFQNKFISYQSKMFYLRD